MGSNTAGSFYTPSEWEATKPHTHLEVLAPFLLPLLLAAACLEATHQGHLPPSRGSPQLG